MKRRLLTMVVIIILALALPMAAFAQAYYFSLDKMVVDVYWNSDGTMSLDYLLTFTNQPGGHVIDFVDVGMPVDSFDFNSIQASINGNPLSVSSDFQGSGGYGFAVEMGRYAIPPGGSGTVRVYVGRVTDVLYNDDNDPEYASAAFAPLYFQSSVISGTTDITVTYHLPPGVQPEEPRWHAAPSGFPSEPQTGFDADGRVTYTWRNVSASGDRSYLFGASFPKKYVPEGSIVTVKPPSISVSEDTIFNLLCLGFFGFMFVGIPALSAIAGNRRKLQYLPPRIAIEGHGIKRGLTAVEAAILMGEPLDKVMTMILFGVVKKGAASVVKRDPLQIQSADPLPEGLHEYEKQFLKAFEYAKTNERRQALQNMVIALVRSVSEKMKASAAAKPSPTTRTSWKKPGSRWNRQAPPKCRGSSSTKISNGPCSTRITTTAPAASCAVRSSCRRGGDATIRPSPLLLRLRRVPPPLRFPCPPSRVCPAPILPPLWSPACRPSRKRSSATSPTSPAASPT